MGTKPSESQATTCDNSKNGALARVVFMCLKKAKEEEEEKK